MSAVVTHATTHLLTTVREISAATVGCSEAMAASVFRVLEEAVSDAREAGLPVRKVEHALLLGRIDAKVEFRRRARMMRAAQRNLVRAGC